MLLQKHIPIKNYGKNNPRTMLKNNPINYSAARDNSTHPSLSLGFLFLGKVTGLMKFPFVIKGKITIIITQIKGNANSMGKN